MDVLFEFPEGGGGLQDGKTHVLGNEWTEESGEREDGGRFVDEVGDGGMEMTRDDGDV